MPKVNDDEGCTAPKHTKKRRLIAFGIVGVLALGGAAFAYFTTTGTGSGNSQAGTSQAITFTAAITPAAGGLVPGGTGSNVVFTATNPSTGNQFVNTVTLTGVIAYSDEARTTEIANGVGALQCDRSQFSMVPVVQNQDIPAGVTVLSDNGTLLLANANFNQDGCKNAYLVASFTSN